MLAKCSVFIATSLDGFIAREDGAIDWLMKANALVPPGEDGGCRWPGYGDGIHSKMWGRNGMDLPKRIE